VARKYKQVHRKEIDFDIKDWEKIERRAEACHTTTSKYLRQVILNAEPTFYDMKEVAPLLNGMRIISNNINQVAKKANETNSIYAEDLQKIKENHQQLCHMLSQFVSTPRWIKV
jgi:macrodomain Ter protein organizer (MatP/YcbG family)